MQYPGGPAARKHSAEMIRCPAGPSGSTRCGTSPPKTTLWPGRALLSRPRPRGQRECSGAGRRSGRGMRARRRGRGRIGVVLQHRDQRDVARVDVQVRVEEVARLDVIAVAAAVPARLDRRPALRAEDRAQPRRCVEPRPGPRPPPGAVWSARRGTPPRPSASSPSAPTGRSITGPRDAPRARARGRCRDREPPSSTATPPAAPTGAGSRARGPGRSRPSAPRPAVRT